MLPQNRRVDFVSGSMPVNDAAARTQFRVVIRRRGRYDRQGLLNIPLQWASDGTAIWSRKCADSSQAAPFANTERDIRQPLNDVMFRRKFVLSVNV